MTRTRLFFATATTLAILTGPALADRDPTPEERTRIEAELKNLGFTSWEDIELEDDGSVWEVDDAVDASGQEFDLELKVDTLEVLERDADD